MIATHPFETARTPDLFIFLHGMLFTNIQPDDFTPTLACLLKGF
jgi:protein SMG6